MVQDWCSIPYYVFCCELHHGYTKQLSNANAWDDAETQIFFTRNKRMLHNGETP